MHCWRHTIGTLRWEDRFANAQINTFPFGLNANHRKILRAHLKE